MIRGRACGRARARRPRARARAEAALCRSASLSARRRRPAARRAQEADQNSDGVLQLEEFLSLAQAYIAKLPSIEQVEAADVRIAFGNGPSGVDIDVVDDELVVIACRGDAHVAGVRPGFVLAEIAGQLVAPGTTLAEFGEKLTDLKRPFVVGFRKPAHGGALLPAFVGGMPAFVVAAAAVCSCGLASSPDVPSDDAPADYVPGQSKFELVFPQESLCGMTSPDAPADGGPVPFPEHCLGYDL